MDKTERTTIRIKKHLLKQTRDIAYQRHISLQDAINLILENGLVKISDAQLQQRRDSMEHASILRDEIAKDYGMDFDDLLEKSKKELK